MPPSRTVAPYSPPQTRSGARDGRSARAASAPFHTGYQPARALQQGDRPPHRRRRHLPRRPRPDPPRRDALHRAERRVASGAPLPIRRLDAPAPRGAAPSPQHLGGERAPAGLSGQHFTDEVSAQLLHHIPGLDCCLAGARGRRRRTLRHLADCRSVLRTSSRRRPGIGEAAPPAASHLHRRRLGHQRGPKGGQPRHRAPAPPPIRHMLARNRPFAPQTPGLLTAAFSAKAPGRVDRPQGRDRTATSRRSFIPRERGVTGHDDRLPRRSRNRRGPALKTCAPVRRRTLLRKLKFAKV